MRQNYLNKYLNGSQLHIHAEQTIKTNSITFPADLCSEREEAGQGLHAVVEFLRKGEDDQPRKREL